MDSGQKPTSSVENGANELTPGFELTPQSVEKPTPEQSGLSVSAEKFEQRAEPTSSGASQVLPQVVVKNTTQTTSDNDDVVKNTTTDNPAIAKDTDKIEKEWVDKAKQIIAETKDDPHEKEERIKHLKSDYIEKRYGRKIGGDGTK
jgi:hypothetical protein